MEIEYKGGNCVVITVKKATIAVDPDLTELGLSNQGQKATVHLLTHKQSSPSNSSSLIINGPGEYEVQNISIKGVPAKPHNGALAESPHSTMYRLAASDLSLAILGHIDPNLTEDQLEQIGVVDVLVLPIGGYGYTLDTLEAIRLIRAIDPKIIVPTHYAEDGLHYPIEQAGIESFLKEVGGVNEVTSKLKLKADVLPQILTVYHLTRTA